MEYNTQREKLIIPEYGRNIQKMVEHCMSIEDRDKRNEYAQTIIVAMGQVNPIGKETPHYKQKLWDHLFIISDYKLDVDSPFEKPVKEEKNEKPSPMKYKESKITYRTYGSFFESLVKKVAAMDECPEKDDLIVDLAQQMKKLYLQWNINTCDEQVLRNQLKILSEGKIVLKDDFQFKTNKELLGVKKKQRNEVKTGNRGKKKNPANNK